MLKLIQTGDADLNLVQQNVKRELDRIDSSIPSARVTATPVTASYQILSTDRLILSKGATTLDHTLPDVRACAGLSFTVKNQAGASNVNVRGLYLGNGAQLIDGVQTFVVGAGQAVTFFSDGTAWWSV